VQIEKGRLSHAKPERSSWDAADMDEEGKSVAPFNLPVSPLHGYETAILESKILEIAQSK
jgi:hypothetical protein